ncbi:MAG TPA: hypothetical protein DEA96_17495 [Leptospiraceae bacterium]|nr:hypothetical protein [Leptospiraceae bacterium]|tara:strand:- start:63551 stop:64051 length:501 start_codon:yes stop_codon:yes gene_type:complete
MQININRLDLFLGICGIMLRNRWVWFLYGIGTLILFAISSFGSDEAPNMARYFMLFASCALAAGVFLIIVLILQGILAVIVVGHQPGILGEHEYLIEEEGLRERTSANDTLHRWPSISYVSTGNVRSYIGTGGAGAHIIPARCFSSYDEPMQFDVVKAEWQEKKRV